MKPYLDLVKRVLAHGEARHEERTGTGTLSVFGGHIEFDLRDRFPLVTAKETRWRVAFLEMLWFLRGEDNTKWLKSNGCTLWDPWASSSGSLGPVYGVQWRSWPGKDARNRSVDQLATLVSSLRRNPQGRRHIVSAWNVAELGEMALMPCHWAFQCYVGDGGYLDMQVNQRSWDLALGAPFNIAQYALLLTLLSRATGLKPRKLSFVYGDAHIYADHAWAMEQIVERGSKDEDGAQLIIETENTDLYGYVPDDFDVVGYLPHPFIPLKVAV